MAVVVGTPRSLLSSADSSSSSALSSTVRVRAARSAIFWEKLSRVRETAWRMRSKRPFLGSSSADFSGSSLPNSFRNIALVSLAELAALAVQPALVAVQIRRAQFGANWFGGVDEFDML